MHYIIEAEVHSEKKLWNAVDGHWVQYDFRITHAVKAKHRLAAKRLMRAYCEAYFKGGTVLGILSIRRTTRKGAMEILNDKSRNWMQAIRANPVSPPDPWVP